MKYSTAFLFAGLVMHSSAATAQMNTEPWGFTPQNRAGIASLIQQAENPNTGAGAGYLSADTLICGDGGSSTAKANSTCIIMNNSNGSINVGQDSDGDQTAHNSSEVNGAESEIDEVLDTLESTE